MRARGITFAEFYVLVTEIQGRRPSFELSSYALRLEERVNLRRDLHSALTVKQLTAPLLAIDDATRIPLPSARARCSGREIPLSVVLETVKSNLETAKDASVPLGKLRDEMALRGWQLSDCNDSLVLVRILERKG